MKNQNVPANKMTQAELEQELKRDVVVDRELDDTQDYERIRAIMGRIEHMRQKRQKQNARNEYTQKKLAEKSGIGLSTYMDYLSGASDNIKLKTVLNIAHALQCSPADFMDEEH